MMTLKEVKDWMKAQFPDANKWILASYDKSNDKTVCVRNLATSRGSLALGGRNQTSIAVKGLSIVLHWTKNPDESEKAAQQLYSLFYGQNPTIAGYRVIKFDMRHDEPLSLGQDDAGINEYVIEVYVTYMKKKESELSGI